MEGVTLEFYKLSFVLELLIRSTMSSFMIQVSYTICRTWMMAQLFIRSSQHQKFKNKGNSYHTHHSTSPYLNLRKQTNLAPQTIRKILMIRVLGGTLPPINEIEVAIIALASPLLG